ncbi:MULTISPECIES: hypothetical protein [Streptomyces]|uniref:Uncharacterized protein n=2 Tax=Streptomyces TaxID=1883 RepID=A0A117IVT6_9ACTN|nr:MULTISPECIES: hypothetical protein [Streptomyces]KUH37387.1 hypothetical protein ATE80_18655 [Streptomyces kanasensis]UUS31641.1 hypothetical protein NRO40_12890 [Streptomyces changanensis]
MKMRHVRAVAVCGVVLVALTGARGSGGGSCDGSGSGSSSSSGGSSSGGSHDNDNGNGTSGGSVSGGGSSGDQAMRDIRIDECKLDASGKNLVARLTITNDGTVGHTYDATVRFKGGAGKAAPYAAARVDDVAVPANGSRTTEATTAYTGGGTGSEYTQCVVTSASRTVG